MKIIHKIQIILITLTCLSSLHADNHANFEKAKKNKGMALMFFDKLLTEPEALRPVLHKNFTFTYMGKIPDTLLPYGVPYDTDSFYSKWLGHIPKLVPDGIELKTTDIIADEKLKSGGGADHFAAAGANDRIWNSLQKLCESSPDTFLRYFANVAIQTACEAWLGPNYQMTAQVNLVHPGGNAQQAHRDYHLGFQTAEVSALYPSHVHELSPALTLQGAIAHCDMPVESGPTKLLPFSQTYLPGYAAWRREDFREVFENRHVQLPLSKGDALFFSPALFHGAGANVSSNIHRMANLLQVSSAFGRAMETIDRAKMCVLTYPSAAKHFNDKRLSISEIKAAIAATAEGYSFPTNLDTDPPKGGLAPETQQALFLRALESKMEKVEFENQLKLMESKQIA